MGNASESHPRWVGPLGIGLCIVGLIVAGVLASTGDWVRAIVSVVIGLVLGAWGLHEYRQSRRS